MFIVLAYYMALLIIANCMTILYNFIILNNIFEAYLGRCGSRPSFFGKLFLTGGGGSRVSERQKIAPLGSALALRSIFIGKLKTKPAARICTTCRGRRTILQTVILNSKIISRFHNKPPQLIIIPLQGHVFFILLICEEIRYH